MEVLFFQMEILFFRRQNQYFLKENNNFFLNLSYDSLANPQLKINGSEFSNMDLN